jgi:hypothetical protein
MVPATKKRSLSSSELKKSMAVLLSFPLQPAPLQPLSNVGGNKFDFLYKESGHVEVRAVAAKLQRNAGVYQW